MLPSINPRLSACKILKQVIVEHTSLDEALAHTAPAELNLIKFLTYGVLREYQSLEFLLARLLNKPLKAKEFDLKIILLLGLFQLKSSRIPAHAAINETVNLSKISNYEYASGLTNAILRRFLREQTDLLNQLASANISEHPPWLLAKIQKAYPDAWPKIIAANNTQAPMHLRINQRKTSLEAYLELLKTQNIQAKIHPDFPNALTLETAADVEVLPKFAEGYASVQDLAAQLAPYFLDLKTGQNVLDACAAPGGKACHLLECSDLNLIAMDIAPVRLKLIKENLERLKLKAHIKQGDASLKQNFAHSFDRILIDAPCSGTGVIRRHPDIKFLRQETDINKLHQLQVKIIKQLANDLKPEGLMLYATCSILEEENDASINAALTELKNFQILPIKFTPSENIMIKPTRYGLQLLPEPNTTDGFYYALLKKTA